MRRLVAAMLAGVVLGFIVGHLSAGTVEGATFDPHNTEQCLAQGTKYNNVPECRHYPRTGSVLMAGVKYGGLTDAQRATMNQLLSEFSAGPNIKFVYAGEASDADCKYALTYEERVYTPGYLYVCGKQYLDAVGISDPRYTWRYADNFEHYADGRLFIPTAHKPLACHEWAHQLGLNHDAGNGCESESYTNGVAAPSTAAIQALNDLHGHVDSVQYLIQQSGSVPTATTSPAPTGSPTASSTPTLAPTPTPSAVVTPTKCPMGWIKRGRC